MSNRPTMLQVYIMMAKLVSLRSTCKRQQNGAVVTSYDMRRVLSIGYNGSPHNTPDCAGGEPGDCGCIHAEMNALLKKFSPEHAYIFITTSPCIVCAKAMLQTNIKGIFFIDYYRDTSPLEYLRLYGTNLEVKQINLNETFIQK